MGTCTLSWVTSDLLQYRPFRNDDPPAIAAVWRSQPPLRGLMQPMSPALFERQVLSKPYFQREGFIVAMDQQRMVGFAHAGFGPNDELTGLAYDKGVTSIVMVVPDVDGSHVSHELLSRSEEYLRDRGATALYGGCVPPHSPFYLGLYGGSQARGVLKSDQNRVNLFAASGYLDVDRCLILQRNLVGFRPRVDRDQMRIRRGYLIEAVLDPPVRNWWEACTRGDTQRTCFSLSRKGNARACGQAEFWDLDPFTNSWGVHAVGLLHVEIASASRRQGLSTHLLGEALRQLQAQGVKLVEAQVAHDNLAALGLFEKLGFEEIDQSIVYRKEL